MRLLLSRILKSILSQGQIDAIKGKKNAQGGLQDLSRTDRELIQKIREKNLTYLSREKLLSLASTCKAIEKSQTHGILIEAGCALGGSAILLAKQKSGSRPLFVYDVFGMIPPPTKEDTDDVHERYQTIVEGKSQGLSGDRYYGYEEDLYAVVQSNFASFEVNCEKDSVTLVKGLVQQTMQIRQPVALAHIDVDWYEPVMTCLERIFPHLVSGGSIILDDYHDWGGCRKATDEFLKGVEGEYIADDSAKSLKITKK